MTDATAAWGAQLTRMEDDLDAHEEQVRLGEVVAVPKWEPPTDLGPLPAVLAHRVTHLNERIKLLSTFVQYQLASTESDLTHLHQQQKGQKGSRNKAIATFLDASV